MRYSFTVKEITKDTALKMIKSFHYSNTLPKINKVFLGFFLGGELRGVITLGYGVRPVHTIRKLFPSLSTADYLEIGRMCMTDDMPRNSESQMLSQCVEWLRKHRPDVKVLFTWADGMLGKVGYVYQASGFMYAGSSPSDIYILDGYKIHPRQTAAFFREGDTDKRITARPTIEQQRQYGIDQYKGNQYKYIRFLCCKTMKTKLMHEALFEQGLAFPKDKDLAWRVQDKETGKYVKCGRPPYKTDFSKHHGLYVLKDKLI